jgi:carboxyl-terminal processing protease
MFKKIKLNVQKLIGVYLCSVLLPVSLFGYSSRSEAFEQSFDLVWNTVNESHWDPSFAGLDWEQVRKDYRPRLRKVRDRGDLVQLLQAMLNELALSHFRILSNSVDPIDRFPRGGYSGLSLKYMDKQAYVVRVAPESPAEEAGIEVGWKLKSIHRKSVKRLIAPFFGICA